MNNWLPAFQEHVLVNENGKSVLDILSNICPSVSKNKLKIAMRYGAVWLSHHNRKPVRVRRAKKNTEVGDEIHIYYDESILFSEIPPAQLISDEGQYSIWNKPSGMFSQGTKWGDHSSIVRWVELFGLANNCLPERSVFLVHRLDRATNGLIVVAHSQMATRRLTSLFENRLVDKRYTAMVKGKYPKKAEFEKLTNKIDHKMAVSIVISSQYQTILNQSELVIRIETGRKHQIRKHLSAIGYPIIGDRLYCAKTASGGSESVQKASDVASSEETVSETVSERTVSERTVLDIKISDNSRPDLMLKSCFLEFLCPFSGENKRYSID